VGLADPQAIVVSKPVNAAAFGGWGCRRGSYPSAQAALYLAWWREKQQRAGFFSDAIPNVFVPPSSRAVPSHLRDRNRDGRPFGVMAGLPLPPCLQRATGSPRPNLPAPFCKGSVLAARLPGLGKGRHRGQAAATARRPTWAAEAEAAPSSRDRQQAARPTPCCGAGCNRQAVAEGEASRRLRQRFWQGASWQRPRQVLVLEARSCSGPFAPSGATPEGGLVDHRGQAREAGTAGGPVQMLNRFGQPQLLELAPIQPETIACLGWSRPTLSKWGGAATFQARPPDFHFAAGSRPSTALSAWKA